jgi:hypothetical protein
MAKLSRRAIIVGASAASLLGAQAPAAAMPLSVAAVLEDPVLIAARAWLANHAKHEALAIEWQKLETRLWRKAGGSISVARAVREGYSEAKRMRRITRQTNRLWRKLKDGADGIAEMDSPTPAGARAKLEVALTIMEPDCDEQAFALIKGAFQELGRIV